MAKLWENSSFDIAPEEDGEKITIANKEIIGQVLENSFENKIVETIISIDLSEDPEKVIRNLEDSIGRLNCVAANFAANIVEQIHALLFYHFLVNSNQSPACRSCANST